MNKRKDDERLARQQAEKDSQEFLRVMSELKQTAPGFEAASNVVVIGKRGYFSRHEAKRAAKAWREAVTRYPHASFYPNLAGYDDDPREIWEFEDASHYVRQWAHFAGMDDLETALRYCKQIPDALGFLAACGVFGETIRRQSLAGIKPTTEQ
jgi:hypothetical protein